MADDLRIDVEGLRSAAASSDDLASRLSVGDASCASGSQPSHAGVSAIFAAAQSVGIRQSGRVEKQARSMQTGAKHYAATDEYGAADIRTTM